MESLLSQLCLIMQLNSNIPNDACLATFNSVYIQSQGKYIYTLAERHYQNKAYETIGKEVIYTTAAVGFIGDAYKRKNVRLSLPIKPYIDNFSMDLTPESQKYEFYWEFRF